MAKLDGIGLAALSAGGLFVYAGLKGYSVPHAVQALIKGQPPSTGGNVNPIGTPTFTTGTGGGVGVGINANIASDFQQYIGKVPYVWAGASPKGWDCSGSCNYVICHDAGFSIPGFKAGSFDGSQHGPSTLGWLAWSSNMIKLSESGIQAGDIVLWQTHMGVVTDGTHYVSAYDTQEGTVVKPIHGGGPIGEIASFWRLK